MMSPGLIFASLPEGSSSWLYVALSVSACTTTTSPARARRRSPPTASVFCNASFDTTDPTLSASTTVTGTAEVFSISDSLRMLLLISC